jgi:two-component system, cell cycle response regulator
VDHANRPTVLLAGDASARPSGLERALTRAGFQLIEREDNTSEPQADAVLITLAGVNGIPHPGLFPGVTAVSATSPVHIVLLSSSDPDGPAAALLQGASDALAAPIHLPELCARLHARIRERQNMAAGEASGAAADPNRAGQVSGIAVAEEMLDRRVQEEFERARRYSLSFSLVLLEVSELAALDDRLGTAEADRRRSEVGGVLRRELRLPDLVVPYGVDEFAIILPETDQIGARQSVTRIRERLAGVVVGDGDPREARSRFSAGIVTYPHPAATQTQDLFTLVEAALTRGKAQSGERIGVAL